MFSRALEDLLPGAAIVQAVMGEDAATGCGRTATRDATALHRKRLKALLNAETDLWAAKPFSRLQEELADVAAWHRGEGEDFHQFEVQPIENRPDYLHVMISIDDGSLARSFSPLTRSFIVYRDGRVEK